MVIYYNHAKRVTRIREALGKMNAQAVLLTDPRDATYVSGYNQGGERSYGGQFGLPVLVPLDGEVVMMIPEVGWSQEWDPTRYFMGGWADDEIGETWIRNFKTWKPGSNSLQTVQEVLKDLKLENANIGIERHTFSYDDYNKITELLPGATLMDFTPAMDEITSMHDEEEISLLRKCGAIGDVGLEALIDAIDVGKSERMLAAEAEYAMRNAGAWGFRNILRTGPYRAFPLSPGASDKMVLRGDVIAADLNVNYKHYGICHLHTLTFGRPSEEDRKIFDLAEEFLGEVLDVLIPGAEVADMAKLWLNKVEKAGYPKKTADSGYGVGHEIGIGPGTNGRRGTIPGNIKNHSKLKPTMAFIVRPAMYVPGKTAASSHCVEFEIPLLIRDAGQRAEYLCSCPKKVIEVTK